MKLDTLPLVHVSQSGQQLRRAIEVQLPDAPKQAAIFIQDITGRMLKQLIVSNQEQQLVLDSREFAPGTYTVVLSRSGDAKDQEPDHTPMSISCMRLITMLLSIHVGQHE
ncbi:MAG: hypothetical protein R2818_03215 [Flavobacteriales bacterium]